MIRHARRAPARATAPKQTKTMLKEPYRSASLPDMAVDTIPDVLVNVARNPMAVAVSLREKISDGMEASKMSGMIIMRPTTERATTPMGKLIPKDRAKHDAANMIRPNMINGFRLPLK